MRFLLGMLGLLVLAFGLGCLNYTSAWNVDHHTEWAASHDLPEPSKAILYGGMAATALGGIVLGRALAPRR